jgi:hypothetical protein
VFDWLFEGRLSVYVFLGALAVLLLIAWWQNRWAWCLAGVGILLVLIGLYWLLDRLVETDREEITRKVEELAAAVRQKRLNAAFEHVSDQFRSPSGMTKQQFRDGAEREIHRYEITEIVVWDFEYPERPSREKGTARASFRFKVKGSFGDFIEHRCEPVFVYEPPRGWRLKSFKIFRPMPNEEVLLPGT